MRPAPRPPPDEEPDHEPDAKSTQRNSYGAKGSVIAENRHGTWGADLIRWCIQKLHDPDRESIYKTTSEARCESHPKTEATHGASGKADHEPGKEFPTELSQPSPPVGTNSPWV